MDFYEHILMSTIQFADAICERDTLSWNGLDGDKYAENKEINKSINV